MQIGCHVSIAGSIDLAFERGRSVHAEAVQIFTQNQRQWKSVRYTDEQIAAFRKARSEYDYDQTPLVAHASYLINMCAGETEKLRKSRRALQDEIERCDRLGVDYLVIHPGFHGEQGEKAGIRKIAETLNRVIDPEMHVGILLENTAGQGSSIGYRMEHLAEIAAKVECSGKVGFCLDTCHLFAAGYDVRGTSKQDATLQHIDSVLNLNRVRVWHFNDSMKALNSRRDRHAAIGSGEIGEEAFKKLVLHPAFKKTPAILEVPGGLRVFEDNIRRLKAMR